MIALVIALIAGLGVHYLYTARVFRWSGLGLGPKRRRSPIKRRLVLDDWLVQAGLHDVNRREFVITLVMLAAFGGVLGALLFGGLLPAVLLAAFGMSFPVASYRHRRDARMATALEAWPRIIEEVRILTVTVGRSIPQALFEVGRRAPVELQPAFADAYREWTLSTDFRRTLALLKSRLADPTADMVCETLLIAHEVGGSDVDKRLEALAEDRQQDLQSRKDATAKQAGARFARLFVLLVPLGMALAGMSVGNGRSAYQTATGQLLVCLAIAMVVLCWIWAGRVMRLPRAPRVFSQ
jgi:tight adherence protein B